MIKKNFVRISLCFAISLCLLVATNFSFAQESFLRLASIFGAGPAGQLITSNAAGNPAPVSAGTIGQVLAAGTGGVPAFTGALTGLTSVTTTGAVTAGASVLYPAALIETVAAGTSVQGDGPLTTTKFFHFITGFDETKVVTLSACAAGNIGELHSIMNAVTNKFAKIFPASGSQINSLGANNAYTVGVTGNGGRTTQCLCQAATQWFCG